MPPAAIAIVPSTGPRTPNASGSLVLPGAIAALSVDQSSKQASNAENSVPRPAATRPQKTAAVALEPEQKRKRQPPNSRRVRSRAKSPLPRAGRHHRPWFLNIRHRPSSASKPPKFVASGFPKPERSTFGPRVYENFVRNLR